MKLNKCLGKELIKKKKTVLQPLKTGSVLGVHPLITVTALQNGP